MDSKSDNNQLSLKEYLFLVVGLIIFFLTGLYLMGYGSFPEGIYFIIAGIGVAIAIPIVIYLIKNIE